MSSDPRRVFLLDENHGSGPGNALHALDFDPTKEDPQNEPEEDTEEAAEQEAGSSPGPSAGGGGG